MQTFHLHNMAGLDELTTEKKLNKLLELEEAAANPSNVAPPTKPLIRRVSHTLRARYNEEECNRYFEPISVAIGPLHHEKNHEQGSRFEIGEKFKLQLAVMFIKHSWRMEYFYNKVKEEINTLRECYDPKEVEKWNDEELAWMFLVDGCALLHFIFLDVEDRWKELTTKDDLIAFAKLDLFLFENQLPYRLLEILIGSCSSEGRGANRQKELKDSINKFINKSVLSPLKQQQYQIIQVNSDQTHPPQEQRQEEEEDEPAHLLALLRRRMIGVKSKEKGKNEKVCLAWRKLKRSKFCYGGYKWPTFRNVRELKAKGIHFRASEKIVNVTYITLHREYRWFFCLPTLTLAPIVVDDATMPKLLNLIAYEVCPDFKNEYEITSYVSFLDSLIDSGEDVKELRDSGVLNNRLGSDEAVAALFNKISDNVVPNFEMYKDLKDRIQEHCDFILAGDLAHCYHTHFRSPWSFLVFLGAIAGLVMTGMETYKSFNEEKPAPVVNNNYYYYHP
ncbi:hypothetical protein SLA2020_310490 [Shorea laevis]